MYGILTKPVKVSNSHIIPKGTRFIVHTEKKPESKLAQVQFPASHPEFPGLFTVVPKSVVQLDTAGIMRFACSSHPINPGKLVRVKEVDNV